MTSPPSFLSCTVKKPSGNSEDCGEMHSVSFSETAGHTNASLTQIRHTQNNTALLLEFCAGIVLTFNGGFTAFHANTT